MSQTRNGGDKIGAVIVGHLLASTVARGRLSDPPLGRPAWHYAEAPWRNGTTSPRRVRAGRSCCDRGRPLGCPTLTHRRPLVRNSGLLSQKARGWVAYSGCAGGMTQRGGGMVVRRRASFLCAPRVATSRASRGFQGFWGCAGLPWGLISLVKTEIPVLL